MNHDLFKELPPVAPELTQAIYAELQRQPLANYKYRKTAGEGRTAAFGLVNRRSVPPDISRNCWLRPYLYYLLLELGKTVPISWNAIQLNQDYAASPHRDKGNTGLSYLVAFGDYSGGELKIHEHPDLSGCYNIFNKPILFDGKALLHSVLPFIGNRISVVYYTLARESASSISDYAPIHINGKWRLQKTHADGTTSLLYRGHGLSDYPGKKIQSSV